MTKVSDRLSTSCNPPLSKLETSYAKGIRQKKKGRTQCIKLQLLRHLGEVIVASLTPKIFFFSLERLIPRLESTTCRFWWKTLSFAPRPGLTSKVQQIEIPKMPIIKLCNIKTMKYTYKGQY